MMSEFIAVAPYLSPHHTHKNSHSIDEEGARFG